MAKGNGIGPWSELKTGKFRPSAVLIPLYLQDGKLATLFTARPEHLRRHPGQIGFPGGAREVEDISPGDTALREAREELALPQNSVTVLGGLSPEVAYTSDFLVFPVLGWLASADLIKQLVPDPGEVKRLIPALLNRFSTQPVLEWKREGVLSFVYPVFPLEKGERVWGVTARILLRLVRLLQQLEVS